jgi:hypothetical protein
MKVLMPQRRIQLAEPSPGLGYEITRDAFAGMTLHIDRRSVCSAGKDHGCGVRAVW